MGMTEAEQLSILAENEPVGRPDALRIRIDVVGREERKRRPRRSRPENLLAEVGSSVSPLGHLANARADSISGPSSSLLAASDAVKDRAGYGRFPSGEIFACARGPEI